MSTIVPVPATLHPLQFAYCPNMSTDDAITITLHTALSHLDQRNNYVRMLFVDYSAAFKIIVPSKLIIKLEALGLNPTLCNWVLDFLTGYLQVVKVGYISTLRSSTLGPHKGACSAPSCTPCSPMTAWPITPPTQSSSLQTIQQ